MAETLRIEIPIETIDNTDPELSNITKNFEKMEKSADSANSAVKKANTTVTQFDRQAEKIEKSLLSWAKEKYEILLEAKDKISPIITTLGNGLRSFTGKTWSITLKAIDLITSPIRGVINLLKNPIFQVGAVLGVSIGLKDSIDTYKNFEAAMSQVQAISSATDAELTKLKGKAKEMGATTKFTAEESAEAFNYMAMAGWKTEDMLSGIEGILNLAAASGEELAMTSDIVTDSLTAFKLNAKDAGHFSDVLASAASNANTTVSGMGETFKYAGTMAGSLGYSIEDVALMTGLMANAGIKGTMSGTALNAIFTRLSTNTSGAADALSDLGIEFYTSEGNARDLSEIMDGLRQATANMTTAQKSNLANTIAGTEAQKGLLAILNASEEDYNKLADAINNADGAAASMSETMLDNLAGSIILLQSAVDGVKISFGERLSPYVRSLSEWLTDQMPAIEQGLDEMMDWFDSKVDRMQRRFNEISGTKEWQNADFFGKVKIAWDEFIADPFLEWWNSIGKAKFADFAEGIGEGIGAGLKVGIMTLLGIDLKETLDEGASIGASFAKGFSEGFDFESISGKLWQGFGNMLSNAGKLLPGGESADLSSIMSAIMLSKIAIPFLSMGKGIAGIGKGLLSTNSGTGLSAVSSLLGSAASGTGLLGKSSMLAIDLGAGNLAGGASLSAGALSAAGAAAGTGAIAAGATLISSAADAYKAIKSEETEASRAYGESSAWKAGGVAAGAAAGAALGSIIPGLGTAVGALIGAGVGGISGWIKGNKIKDEYQKNAAEMQKEAEKNQKILESTGLSLSDVTFKNKELEQSMKDTEVSAEEFAQMFQEKCAEVAKNAFGDITLSLTEIKKISSGIAFGDMAEELDTFSQAASDSEAVLNKLHSSVNELKKENWKIGLKAGAEISDINQDNYKAAIDNFLDSNKEFLESNHYEVTASLKLIAGDDADTYGIDSYYEDLNSQIEELGTELADKVDIALADGIITLDEAAEIENLQKQISSITDKLASAENNASWQAVKIKYSGADLDIDSFRMLQEELKANANSESEQAYSALNQVLTNLNAQYADGAITKDEFEEASAKAGEEYHNRIKEVSLNVESFQLESIAEAFGEQLDGILPELEGTTSEKLKKVLEGALMIKPDVESWEPNDIEEWFGLGELEGEDIGTISDLLKATAESIPKGAFKEAGAECGTATTDSAIESILAEVPSLRTATQDALERACANLYEVEAAVRLKPNYIDGGYASSYLRGGSSETLTTSNGYASTGVASSYLQGHAAGGYVSGGPQLSWLAEEGYGEYVIPTNPSRRARALDLYEQAGVALGVSAHAAGGYVAGSNLSNNALNYNLFTKANLNAPFTHNGITEDNQSEETYPLYETIPTSASGGSVSPSVQVSVSMTPEFVIQGGEMQSEEDIMQVIRRHMKEMADELGGEIAEKLEKVFSNMPLKEA